MTFSGSPLSSNKFLKGVETIGTEVVVIVISCIGCMRFCITAAMTIATISALAILSGVVGIGIMGFKSSKQMLHLLNIIYNYFIYHSIYLNISQDETHQRAFVHRAAFSACVLFFSGRQLFQFRRIQHAIRFQFTAL